MLVTRSQRGLSMVEALVALLVLSIGMLGIAGLHVESVKANRTALIRSQALTLVNDMADRIRANRTARDAYLLAEGDLPDPGTCVAGVDDCSAAELATDDLARWVLAVRGALPGSAAGDPAVTSVDFDDGATPTQPDTYTIQVGWSEPGEPDLIRYAMTVQLIAGAVL